MNTPVTPTHHRQLPDPALAREWLAAMLLVRAFDQRAAELHQAGRIGGFLHTTTGEEALIVGVTRALEDRDWLLTTHRAHAFALARGSQPAALMAELLGRQSGLMGGLGGALHTTDVQRRVLGGFGLIAEHLPVAAGVALGSSQAGRAEVAVAVLGAGGAANGAFSEALELASSWRLPVVVICARETNGSDRRAQRDALARKVEGLGVKALACSGMDVLDVQAVVSDALRIARTERRSVLVDVATHRAPTAGPSGAKPEGDAATIEAWKARDPVVTFGDRLVEVGVLSHSDRTRIGVQAGTIIEQGTAIAARGKSATADTAADALWSEPHDASVGAGSWWTWPAPAGSDEQAPTGRQGPRR